MSRRAYYARGATALALVTLLAAAGAVGALFAPEHGSTVDLNADRAGSIAVATLKFDDRRQAGFRPEAAVEVTTVLVDEGTVTRTTCRPGMHLGSGTSPVQIDNRPILALTTEEPLWRDLSRGATGSDVRALQSELKRLGYTVVDDGKYGDSTVEAVKELQRQALGSIRPTGALPLASVLWLPAPLVTVSGCGAPLGSHVTAHTPFATLPGELVALRLVSVPSGLVPGPRSVRVAETGLSAPVGLDGAVTDIEFLRALRDLPAISDALSRGTEAVVQMDFTLTTPIDVSVVPPGALFALEGTRGCVEDERGEPHVVEIVSSALGQAYVKFQEQPSGRVQLRSTLDAADCK